MDNDERKVLTVFEMSCDTCGKTIVATNNEPESDYEKFLEDGYHFLFRLNFRCPSCREKLFYGEI